MPVLAIQLPIPITLNHSLQVGDILYYVPVSSLGGFDTNNGSDIVRIGPYLGQGSVEYNGVHYPSVQGIYALIDEGVLAPNIQQGDITPNFLLFSKDNIVNENGLLGYHMTVTIENDSDDYAELFSVGTELFESSK